MIVFNVVAIYNSLFFEGETKIIWNSVKKTVPSDKHSGAHSTRIKQGYLDWQQYEDVELNQPQNVPAGSTLTREKWSCQVKHLVCDENPEF